MLIMTGYYKEFLISDAKTLIQLDRVYEMLSNTYWAKERSIETIKKSIENSICFGVYLSEKQIGFARCVTDFSTVYWLADVIIDVEYQKLGLGKALIKAIVEDEKFKALRGILATKDAHGLYSQYDFHLSDGRFMCREPQK